MFIDKLLDDDRPLLLYKRGLAAAEDQEAVSVEVPREGVPDAKPVSVPRLHGPMQKCICKVKLGLPARWGEVG